MAKHVFLSFVEEDLELVKLFRGQAKNKNSALEFDDYSVRVPYNSSNADYIRRQITERIRQCSATICLIGSTTSTSSWVDWELRKASELGKKVLGVRLHSNIVKDKPPIALGDLKAKILNWDIPAIVAAL